MDKVKMALSFLRDCAELRAIQDFEEDSMQIISEIYLAGVLDATSVCTAVLNFKSDDAAKVSRIHVTRNMWAQAKENSTSDPAAQHYWLGGGTVFDMVCTHLE